MITFEKYHDTSIIQSRACEVFCRHSGIDVQTYRYYDPNTCGMDFKGAMEDLSVRSCLQPSPDK